MSQKNPTTSGINKNWKPLNDFSDAESVAYYINGVKENNRTVLSEAITIVESKTKNTDFILRLLDGVYDPLKETLRIGISGSPGAGKSTFINVLGDFLTKQGKKVAVLAVDPSSEITKGSILGDKTRMYKLIQNPDVYIRPTPSSSFLGGVAASTKESILLCEAAGYDIILIETVGVGQSETLVKNMVDLFCLILLPGAGDELQGIKKGIVEMSDLFIINKADSGRELLAKESKKFYKNAIQLSHSASQKKKDVLICSSLEQKGIKKVWESLKNLTQFRKENYSFDDNRVNQNQKWLIGKKEAITIQKLSSLMQQIIDPEKDDSKQIFKSLIAYNEKMDLRVNEIKNRLDD